MILQEAEDRREALPGEDRRRAVDTVPAYCQRTISGKADKDAGTIAGMTSNGSSTSRTGRRRVPLDKEAARKTWCSTGGGTSRAVLEIGDGVFEVKETAGDNHLGATTSTRRSRTGGRRVQEEPRHRSLRRHDGASSVCTRRRRRRRSSSPPLQGDADQLPFITAD